MAQRVPHAAALTIAVRPPGLLGRRVGPLQVLNFLYQLKLLAIRLLEAESLRSRLHAHAEDAVFALAFALGSDLFYVDAL